MTLTHTGVHAVEVVASWIPDSGGLPVARGECDPPTLNETVLSRSDGILMVKWNASMITAFY
jgi:hypothetical protein